MEVIKDYADIMRTYDPSKNITKNILSKYEKVKILGLRAEQLQRGSESLIDWKTCGTPEYNPRVLAEEELKQRKLPFMICRRLPDGTKEYYRLQDMIIM